MYSQSRKIWYLKESNCRPDQGRNHGWKVEGGGARFGSQHRGACAPRPVKGRAGCWVREGVALSRCEGLVVLPPENFWKLRCWILHSGDYLLWNFLLFENYDQEVGDIVDQSPPIPTVVAPMRYTEPVAWVCHGISTRYLIMHLLFVIASKPAPSVRPRIESLCTQTAYYFAFGVFAMRAIARYGDCAWNRLSFSCPIIDGVGLGRQSSVEIISRSYLCSRLAGFALSLESVCFVSWRLPTRQHVWKDLPTTVTKRFRGKEDDGIRDGCCLLTIKFRVLI